MRSLSISWAGEVRISVAHGLWYLDPDGSAPPVSTAPVSTTGVPPTVPPTTDPAPAPVTTSPAPPAATTTTAPAPTTTTTAPTTTTLPIGRLRSSPILSGSAELRNGITVRRVMANNPLADVLGELDGRSCAAVECEAFVI
ncbi:MAG: hypothetical protein IT196_00845 [Acidimicrobiales bacterium]|nr:hypothetical protein [Acidimicrobiales bacterium]